MRRKALIFAVLIAASPSLALAQTGTLREEGSKACNGDVNRFCRRVMEQGDQVILGCLQENANKITRACRKFLEDNGQL